MSLWMAAMWGLVGSAVAEALNLYGMMRPTTESGHRWQWPWRDPQDRPIVLFAVLLRMVAGTGLAAAAGAGGLATTAFASFTFGVAAPLVIAKMFDQFRVADRPADPSGDGPNGSHDDAA
ncbi:hypothetical protein [Micromonospora echinaurantiaca]|nr:hypothetical protein [Micromonospora echinaurantiaca]